MAITIQKRKPQNGKGWRYTATVRLDGFDFGNGKQSVSRTFSSKEDAERWARECQVAAERGTYRAERFDRRVARRMKLEAQERKTETPTLAQALERYLELVTPHKKGAKAEADRIRQWQKRPLGAMPITDLRTADFKTHIREREEQGRAGSTIRNELTVISDVYNTAIHDEQWHKVWPGYAALTNPISPLYEKRGVGRKSAMPKIGDYRDRRLMGDEEERLRAALAQEELPDFGYAWEIALATGMRQGEILAIERAWVRLENGTLQIPKERTKTEKKREVVLGRRARAAIEAMMANPNRSPALFTIVGYQVANAWRRVLKRAGIEDLTFHDMRHEACSRMSERGAGLKTIQKQSGHTTMQALMRYLNPTTDEVRRFVD